MGRYSSRGAGSANSSVWADTWAVSVGSAASVRYWVKSMASAAQQLGDSEASRRLHSQVRGCGTISNTVDFTGGMYLRVCLGFSGPSALFCGSSAQLQRTISKFNRPVIFCRHTYCLASLGSQTLCWQLHCSDVSWVLQQVLARTPGRHCRAYTFLAYVAQPAGHSQRSMSREMLFYPY